MRDRTPRTLITLPTELLEDIVLRLPSLGTAAATCRTLKDLTSHPSTQRRWIAQWFLNRTGTEVQKHRGIIPTSFLRSELPEDPVETLWRLLLTDPAEPFDRLSLLYEETREDPPVNRFYVNGIVRRAPISRVLGTPNAEYASTVLVNGSPLEYLLSVFPPPLDAVWHPGNGYSPRGPAGERFWTSIMMFAAFHNLVGAFRLALEKVIVGVGEGWKDICQDAMQSAVMGGAIDVVRFFVSSGIRLRTTSGVGRVSRVGWKDCLREAVEEADFEDAESSMHRARVVQCFLEACGNGRDDDGMGIWDHLMPLGAGDAGVMEVLLRRACPNKLAAFNANNLTIAQLHNIALDHLTKIHNRAAPDFYVDSIARIAIVARRLDILLPIGRHFTAFQSATIPRTYLEHLMRLLHLAIAPPSRSTNDTSSDVLATAEIIQFLLNHIPAESWALPSTPPAASPMFEHLLPPPPHPSIPLPSPRSPSRTKEFLDLTVKTGNPAVLVHMLRHGLDLSHPHAHRAVSGSLTVGIMRRPYSDHAKRGLDYLVDIGQVDVRRDGGFAAQVAAESGDIESLEWLRSKGLEYGGRDGWIALTKSREVMNRQLDSRFDFAAGERMKERARLAGLGVQWLEAIGAGSEWDGGYQMGR
ncbi:hypothetical protein HK097_010612 [Rhizophlyctis rosea]|uniref:F-box domain-containing protein n=1 Tax=Rhizophlyctis rosea TaxID=64517 RepID=A0AAD5X3Y4_9FUNG|nr:hypothetical protein HK097_010612 [Rhizophlyctis rosea]